MQSQYSQEVQTGNRFEFGKNWKRFLLTLTEDQIEAATYSLKRDQYLTRNILISWGSLMSYIPGGYYITQGECIRVSITSFQP